MGQGKEKRGCPRRGGPGQASTSPGRRHGGNQAAGAPSRSRKASAAGAARIRPSKRRKLQLTRTGARKLFDEAAQQDFLEWFAATCNVSWSAEQAGFNYKTVLRHRMNDERFAEAWDRALKQGYARLEAKQLETKKREAPIGVEGDRDAPEMDDIDPYLAMQLLREHRREIAGVKKPGRAPTAASNKEVFDALVKRLRAFGIRVEEEERREREAREGKGDAAADKHGSGDGPGQCLDPDEEEEGNRDG